MTAYTVNVVRPDGSVLLSVETEIDSPRFWSDDEEAGAALRQAAMERTEWEQANLN